MGRTAHTVREEIDDLEREWRPFRRSLRRRDQPAFDAVFERARSHADAASQQAPRDPWRAFVMAVLVSQEREIRALRDDCEAFRESHESGDDGDHD